MARHNRQREPSTSPHVLVIENTDPSENIILALEDLEVINDGLRNSIKTNSAQIDILRKLLGDI